MATWAVGTVAAMLAAGTTLGLAVWLLAIDFHSRLHRAFSLLLCIQATFSICAALVGHYSDLWGRLYIYYAIALPFAALHFAGVFRDRYGATRRLRRPFPMRSMALLLGALAFETAYFLDHGLNRTATSYGPLQMFGSLTALTNAGIAYLFAFDAARATGHRRRSFLLVSLGFALSPMYGSAFGVMNLFSETVHGFVALPWFVLADQVGQLVPFVVLLAMAIEWNRMPGRGAVEQGALWTLAVAGVAGLAMGAFFGFLPSEQHKDWTFLLALFQSLADLGLPAVVGYALLRHHLFDIDLKVKSTLRQSVAAAFLAGIFFVTSNALQFFFPAANLATALGVAGIVALALWPCERLAKRLVDRWLPGVAKTPDYIDGRRRALYQSALEQAFSDGNVTLRERRLLDRLRADLGLTDQEANDVEARVRPVAGT